MLGIPIDAGGVQKLERVQEVLGIGFVDILDPKVVHNEGESEGAGAMGPNARRDGYRGIAVRPEELDETIIGEAPGLGQAVYALSNLDVDMTVVNKLGEVILEHDGIGNNTDWDSHVGVVVLLVHRCFQVEVLQVGGHKFSIGG